MAVFVQVDGKVVGTEWFEASGDWWVEAVPNFGAVSEGCGFAGLCISRSLWRSIFALGPRLSIGNAGRLAVDMENRSRGLLCRCVIHGFGSYYSLCWAVLFEDKTRC